MVQEKDNYERQQELPSQMFVLVFESVCILVWLLESVRERDNNSNKWESRVILMNHHHARIRLFTLKVDWVDEEEDDWTLAFLATPPLAVLLH